MSEKQQKYLKKIADVIKEAHSDGVTIKPILKYTESGIFPDLSVKSIEIKPKEDAS